MPSDKSVHEITIVVYGPAPNVGQGFFNSKGYVIYPYFAGSIFRMDRKAACKAVNPIYSAASHLFTGIPALYRRQPPCPAKGHAELSQKRERLAGHRAALHYFPGRYNIDGPQP